MDELRLYDEKKLATCSKLYLEHKLAMVQSSDELTREEIKQNVERINYALNGGAKNTRFDVLEDIKAGLADDIDKGDK